MRIALLLLPLLLLLPSVALAQSPLNSMTRVEVYVPDPPHVSAMIVQTDNGLRCDWTITDLDKGDSFRSVAEWSRSGVLMPELTAVVDNCSVSGYCSSPVLALAKPGEEWKCSVHVTDSYKLSGSSEAIYSMTPLSFFGGLVQVIGKWTCGWLRVC